MIGLPFKNGLEQHQGNMRWPDERICLEREIIMVLIIVIIIHIKLDITHSMSNLVKPFKLRGKKKRWHFLASIDCPAHQKPSPALGLVDSLMSSSVQRAQSLISECP